MIKTTIIGASGRMGRSIASILVDDDSVEITGALEVSGHPDIGKSLGDIVGNEKIATVINEDFDEACDNSDILIDFTAPESTLMNLKYAYENGKSMVIGTTGFSHSEQAELEKLAEKIPCVISPNMSIGVNILFELSKKVASLIGDSYDIEIVEAHHRNKVDAPSGTAIGIAKSVAQGLKVKLDDAARYERYGKIGERKKGEIGIQTIRGGDVVGDHTVMFLGDGERLELTHKASNRDNFSKGVLLAVKWLPGKPPGIYSMKDVLGL